MRSTSPKQLAILVAFIASLTAAGAGIGILFLRVTNPLILLLFIGLLIFFIIYLIVFYAINRFIFNRIRPIYKTIQTIRQEEDRLFENIEDRDLIEDVQKDVMHWARKKTREISQLRQLERYRREFLGDVSHELKTPIFNIQGYILTLLDGGLEDEEINHLYLERAEKSVNRLISIVNDLESISRLESGELKLEQKRFDIVKLIEEVSEELEMQAKERNIKLKLDRGNDKSIMVRADRTRIMEAANNLINNSIKYGKDGGRTVIRFMDMGDDIMIEIADDGIGISEKDLPRIFDRFFRTDKSRSREMGGTGLGLAIVKHIIEAHNQTINVQSTLGKGTSFTFTLRKA